MVRMTYRPARVSAVYRGRRATNNRKSNKINTQIGVHNVAGKISFYFQGICSAYDIILVCQLHPTQFFGDKKLSKPMSCRGKNDENMTQCNGHVTQTLEVCNTHRVM